MNKAERAAYMRAWTAKNAARVNEMRRARYAANPEPKRLRDKAHYERHKVAVLEKCKEYRDANKEKIAARKAAEYAARDPAKRESERLRVYAHFLKNRERYRLASLAYAAAHREEVAQRTKEWAKNNPELRQISNANRRGRKVGGRLSPGLAGRLLSLQKGRCSACRAKLVKYHLDHIEPLALGGAHEDANIQLLCPPCNLAKAARPPVEFMQSRGLLL